MQDILRVTEQTTAGTQRTAEAVDELLWSGLRTEGVRSPASRWIEGGHERSSRIRRRPALPGSRVKSIRPWSALALPSMVKKPGEVTQFKFCRTHVLRRCWRRRYRRPERRHQALTDLENLLQTLESDPGANAAAALPVLRGLHGLRNFSMACSRANHTSPCAFCRYVPAWLIARRTSGTPGDFFYPDLSLRPPRSTIAAPNSAPTKSVPYYVPSA